MARNRKLKAPKNQKPRAHEVQKLTRFQQFCRVVVLLFAFYGGCQALAQGVALFYDLEPRLTVSFKTPLPTDISNTEFVFKNDGKITLSSVKAYMQLHWIESNINNVVTTYCSKRPDCNEPLFETEFSSLGDIHIGDTRNALLTSLGLDKQGREKFGEWEKIAICLKIDYGIFPFGQRPREKRIGFVVNKKENPSEWMPVDCETAKAWAKAAKSQRNARKAS